jgi:glycosyltransferase involved in cell wall biosynthesis
VSRPVLLVASSGTTGGAERVLLDWSRALAPPVLLACPPGPLAALAASQRTKVVPLAARPLRRRGRTGRAALDLARFSSELAGIVRRVRPAAVVASGLRPVLAAAPLAGVPVVAVHHDLPAAAPAAAARLATRRAQASIAVSRAVAARMGHRSVVIHPGVDAAAWALPAAPAGPPRALLLGALVAWKRPDLALEVAARFPELELDVAGAPLPGDPPGIVAALQTRAAAPDLAGRVRFLGALEDPRPALSKAHALLHCADREPFGLALVEALAAGRPVAAPAAGGPLEIVTPACGRLYAPGDADAGAAALRAAIALPAAAAKRRAAAFDGAAAAERFAAVVERACKNGV